MMVTWLRRSAIVVTISGAVTILSACGPERSALEDSQARNWEIQKSRAQALCPHLGNYEGTLYGPDWTLPNTYAYLSISANLDPVEDPNNHSQLPKLVVMATLTFCKMSEDLEPLAKKPGRPTQPGKPTKPVSPCSNDNSMNYNFDKVDMSSADGVERLTMLGSQAFQHGVTTAKLIGQFKGEELLGEFRNGLSNNLGRATVGTFSGERVQVNTCPSEVYP